MAWRIGVQRAADHEFVDFLVDRNALARLEHRMIAQGFRQFRKATNGENVVLLKPNDGTEVQHTVISGDGISDRLVTVEINVGNRCIALVLPDRLVHGCSALKSKICASSKWLGLALPSALIIVSLRPGMRVSMSAIIFFIALRCKPS